MGSVKDILKKKIIGIRGSITEWKIFLRELEELRKDLMDDSRTFWRKIWRINFEVEFWKETLKKFLKKFSEDFPTESSWINFRRNSVFTLEEYVNYLLEKIRKRSSERSRNRFSRGILWEFSEEKFG